MDATEPVYVVADLRYREKATNEPPKLRILGSYREAADALAAARLLRWAGSPAQVLLVTEVRDVA